MTEDSRKNGEETAGRDPGGRFQPGNPGRPKGARHKATLAAEALLDGEAEGLTRKAVEAALGGDMAALRLCLDRIVPPRRERPINFRIPPLKSAEDAARRVRALRRTAVLLGSAARFTPVEVEYEDERRILSPQ